MKKIIVASLIFCLWAGPSSAADAVKFTGEWKIDLERTLEEAKKSPKFKPEQAESLNRSMARVAGELSLRITDKEVVLIPGAKEVSFPYTVESGSDTSVVLAVNEKGNSVKLTLTLIEGKFLNMKSSGSDDMDFFVWKKSE